MSATNVRAAISIPASDKNGVATLVRAAVSVPMAHKEDGVGSTFYSFKGLKAGEEHIAVKLGPDTDKPLVRIHSECLTGDVFGSQRCDCGPQLQEAISRISSEGGYLIYLRQEGRGIGLYAKLDAYNLQDRGLDTFEANAHLNLPEDGRDFNIAAHILNALNVTQCRLITNNPDKVAALQACGIEVDEVIPTGVFLTTHNRRYLAAKADKKKHQIHLPD